MFRWLNLIYDLKGVIIRNDNGSQFLANQVRAFLVQLEARGLIQWENCIIAVIFINHGQNRCLT